MTSVVAAGGNGNGSSSGAVHTLHTEAANGSGVCGSAAGPPPLARNVADTADTGTASSAGVEGLRGELGELRTLVIAQARLVQSQQAHIQRLEATVGTAVAQQATRIMQAQGTFGCLLFNTSKQAVNPGKDFGPYGLPKAATLFLVKQYALDHGKDGIRANAVNADRIRSGLLTDDMVAARSKARGLSEADYMAGNLLKREVTAEDVADAFVYLATATKTTAAVVTVDGGNIEASLR